MPTNDQPCLSPSEQQKIRATLPDDLPELGEIEEAHSVSNFPPPWVWFVLACAPLLFAAFMFKHGFTKPQQDPERKAIFSIGGVLSAVGVASIVTGVVLIFFPRATSPDRFIFCNVGVVHSRWEQVDLIPWMDLVIRKLSAKPSGRLYKVNGRVGEPVALQAGILESPVIKAIQDAQVIHALPRLIQAIEEGERIKFGSLGVSADGLWDRETRIPWENVKALDFTYDLMSTHQLFLAIGTHGEGGFKINASEELPNIWLFMELVSKIHPPLAKFKNSQASWLR